MRYCIVCGDCPEDLEEGVNAKLADGWELHGGVSTTVEHVISLFAMVNVKDPQELND
jgi:hypothetical protein